MRHELKARLLAARDIAAKAEAQNRDYTASERRRVDELMAKAEKLAPAIDRQKALEGLAAQINALEPGDNGLPGGGARSVPRRGSPR
ncbi:MAG TPA: hypothetical protein VGC11_04080 [Acidimicrobiia bacterium]